MPFEDEKQVVDLAPWSPRWATEFATLAEQLGTALGSLALAIQHIGSTSVPGLAAKDVIDVQVVVRDVHDEAIDAAFKRLGYRRRPEPWNQVDIVGHEEFAKAVYAPPAGVRAVNVHVRTAGSGSARYALLFRDYLRADPAALETWAALKMRVRAAVADLAPYGQIKDAALPLLMRCAEDWAAKTGCTAHEAAGA